MSGLNKDIQQDLVQFGIKQYDKGCQDMRDVIVESLRELFPEIPEIADTISKIQVPTVDEPGEEQ